MKFLPSRSIYNILDFSFEHPLASIAKKRIAIFKGLDLFSDEITARLIPHFKNWKILPHIFEIEPKKAIPSHLRDLELFERQLATIADDIIFKHLSSSQLTPPVEPLYKQVIELGLPYDEIKDVSSKELFQTVDEIPNLFAAISIRPYQIFKSNFLFSLWEKDIPFWNLHTGQLPEYRGAMPLFWQMLDQKNSTTLTLHKVSSRVDAGNIVGEFTDLTVGKNSYLENLLNLVPSGVQLILKCLDAKLRGYNLDGSKQKAPLIGAPYNSFPKPADINKFYQQGNRLNNPTQLYWHLASTYLPTDHNIRCKFLDEIQYAVREEQKKVIPIPSFRD